MRVIPYFLSYTFHPIFAPLISVFLLFHLPIYLNYRLTEEYFNYIYLVFIVNLIIAPLLISIFLWKKKVVSSLEMDNVKERQIPYFVSLVFYFFTYFLLNQIDFPEFYMSAFSAATLTLGLLFILSTLNQKTSAHLSGLGGICGILIVSAVEYHIDTSAILICFILIAGMVASARYALKAHSFMQLFTGFLIGLGSQLILLI